MSLLTVFNSEAGWLATDQRIFASDTLGRTSSALELAAELSRLIEGRQGSIEAAMREGHAAGFAQGSEEAHQVSQQAAAEALALLEQRYARAEADLRRQVSQLALDVVRKIAAEVAPAAWLHAQADAAAAGLVDGSRLVLRVHVSQLDAVRAVWQRVQSSPISDVLGDDDMEVDMCVLDTPRGSIDVDLQTQLQRIEQLLDATP